MIEVYLCPQVMDIFSSFASGRESWLVDVDIKTPA